MLLLNLGWNGWLMESERLVEDYIGWDAVFSRFQISDSDVPNEIRDEIRFPR